jgi:hypothetical protein
MPANGSVRMTVLPRTRRDGVSVSMVNRHTVAELDAARNCPGPLGGVHAPGVFSAVDRISVARLYGRAGGLTAKYGGCRPGQLGTSSA